MSYILYIIYYILYFIYYILYIIYYILYIIYHISYIIYYVVVFLSYHMCLPSSRCPPPRFVVMPDRAPLRKASGATFTEADGQSRPWRQSRFPKSSWPNSSCFGIVAYDSNKLYSLYSTCSEFQHKAKSCIRYNV